MAIRRNPVGHRSARSAGWAPNTPRLSSTSARSPITWSLTRAWCTGRACRASDSTGGVPKLLADRTKVDGDDVVVRTTGSRSDPNEVVDRRDLDRGAPQVTARGRGREIPVAAGARRTRAHEERPGRGRVGHSFPLRHPSVGEREHKVSVAQRRDGMAAEPGRTEPRLQILACGGEPLEIRAPQS